MSDINITVTIIPTGARIGMKVDSNTLIFDLCRDIRSRQPDVANVGNPNDYGIFVWHTDSKQAYWLENSRTISFYNFKDMVEVDYRCKHRRIVVRTLDDTKKTIQIDDSKTVAELMLPICSKIGITNYEEYSLVRCMGDEEKASYSTIRKSKSLAKDYEKLEKLKQKLHTDDELNWLSKSKTLRQQGVEEFDEVILRRKYFFSDQNVDARDPVQLNLLYVQLKSAILNGSHPITVEEAIDLAGIQCQIEYNNYVAEKMKANDMNLKDFLPKEYSKLKGIEKKIAVRHQELAGISELDGKVRYTKLCRSLPTYGITFFLIKEKIKGKNRLIPRLFGITRDSIMRVDEKTKEIIQEWSLTSVKRWAATANLFTVDFGQSSETNLVMQTTEGEQISQLISGYIDIIVKKQKATDSNSLANDEENMLMEDSVEPAKASMIAHQQLPGAKQAQESLIALPGVIRAPGQSVYTQGVLVAPYKDTIVIRQAGHAVGHVQNNSQQFQLRNLDQPQRALAVRFHDNISIIQAATERLNEKMDFANVGQDTAAQRWRQQSLEMAKAGICSNLGAMSTATGDLVAMVMPDNSDCESSDGSVDYNLLNTAVSSIGLHMRHLMDNVRLTVQLHPEASLGSSQLSISSQDSNQSYDSQRLLDAARNLSQAFQDLIRAAQPPNSGEHPPRKEILEAANLVGERCKIFLQASGSTSANGPREGERTRTLSDNEWVRRDALLARAKAVTNATANLVLCSKRVATLLSASDDVEGSTQMIASAKMAGIATSQLATSCKVLAYTMDQPACQQKIILSAKQVGRAVESVLQAAAPLHQKNDPILNQVEEYTTIVHANVEQLLELIQSSSVMGHQDTLVSTFLSASDRLANPGVDPGPALVRLGHQLAKAGCQMVMAIKEMPPSPEANTEPLIRALAEAAKRLGQKTKEFASYVSLTSPHCKELSDASHNMVRLVLSSPLALTVLRGRATLGLQQTTRLAATSANQLVAVAQEAARHSRASSYQLQLDITEMTEKILPVAVFTCSQALVHFNHPLCQSDLHQASQHLDQTLSQLLQSSEGLCPTVKDPCLQTLLSSSIQDSKISLDEMALSLRRIDAIVSLEASVASASRPTTPQGSRMQVDHTAVRHGGLAEIETCLQRLMRVQEEISTAEMAVQDSMLLPLPGEKLESCCTVVGHSTHSLHQLLPQLTAKFGLNASGDVQTAPLDQRRLHQTPGDGLVDNFVGTIGQLATGCRGLAAFQVDDRQGNMAISQLRILKSARDVTTQGQMLLQNIRQTLASPNQQIQLSQCKLLPALHDCTLHIPGRREVDQLSSKISQRAHQLAGHSRSPSRAHQGQNGGIISPSANKKPLPQLQSEFNYAATTFSGLVKELGPVDCVISIARLTSQLLPAYEALMEAGEDLQEHPGWSSTAGGVDLWGGLADVTERSGELMNLVRGMLDGGASESAQNMFRHDLIKAANAVSGSLDQLVSTACSVRSLSIPQGTIQPPISSPGVRQCEACVRQLEARRSELQQPPVQPINSDDYFVCLEKLDAGAQELNIAMGHLSNQSTFSQNTQFADNIKAFTEISCKLLEAASQGTYLIGSSHPLSHPGQSGVSITQGHPLLEHQTGLSMSCAALADPNISEIRAREVAGIIAKRAAAACQMCKQLVIEFNNPIARKQLLECAKEVARSTSGLVASVRGASTPSPGPGQINQMEERSNWPKIANQVAMCIDRLVSQLTTAPEFARQPAVIAPEAQQMQKPLVNAILETINQMTNFIQRISEQTDAHNNNNNNNKPPTLLTSRNTLNNALQQLNSVMRMSPPGQRQCEDIQQEISALLRELDRGSLAAANDTLSDPRQHHHHGNTDQAFLQITTILEQMKGLAPTMAASGKGNCQELGRGVARCGSYTQPLVEASLKCASSLRRSQEQMEVLEQTKTVLEALSQFTLSLQQAGGNPKMVSVHKDVDECSQGLVEVCQDLSKLINGIANRQGSINNTVNNISRAISSMSQPSSIAPQPAHQLTAQLLQEARQVAAHSQEILVEASASLRSSYYQKGCVGAGGVKPAISLGEQFLKLAQVVQQLGTVLQDNSPRVADNIRTAAQALGHACIDQIRSQLPDQARQVSQCVSDLVSAVQVTVRGVQAISEAHEAVQTIIADLNTAILFASAGSLLPEVTDSKTSSPVPDDFPSARETILRAAKNLVTTTRDVVTSTCNGAVLGSPNENKTVTEDRLVVSLGESCNWIRSLASATKVGAAGLGPGKAPLQVALMNAALDVATGLACLLQCAKDTVGSHQGHDKNKLAVKECAQTMVNNVTTLLKTVKTAEDETLRGTRALEAAIEAMKQEMGVLIKGGIWETSDPELEDQLKTGHSVGIGPEHLIRATKPIMVATAKAFAVSNNSNQEDIMITANSGRKAVSDLARHLKLTLLEQFRRSSSSSWLETPSNQNELKQTAHHIVTASTQCIDALVALFLTLLQCTKEGPYSPAKNQMSAISARITESVHIISATAAQLKGADLMDPDDTTLIAENELLGAANQIEEAAKKLALIKPRKPVKPTSTGSSVPLDTPFVNLDSELLGAVRGVIQESAGLVQAASVAQQELVAQGRSPSTGSSRDRSPSADEEETQWSQGLISAAHLVSAAVHNVVECANSLVVHSTPGAPERLVSASRQVASSTAQLLVACIVKADPNSNAKHRLQMSGASVKRSTEALVRVAQQLVAKGAAGPSPMRRASQDSTNGSTTNGGASGQVLTHNQTPPSGPGRIGGAQPPPTPPKPTKKPLPPPRSGMVSSMRQMMQTQADIDAKEAELEHLRGHLVTIRSEQQRASLTSQQDNQGQPRPPNASTFLPK